MTLVGKFFTQLKLTMYKEKLFTKRRLCCGIKMINKASNIPAALATKRDSNALAKYMHRPAKPHIVLINRKHEIENYVYALCNEWKRTCAADWPNYKELSPHLCASAAYKLG